jgi:hypothetical protein
VLLLASPIDPRTRIGAVQQYERALRAAGKTVEAHYYSDGRHVVTLNQPTAEDATQRTIDFFRRHLFHRWGHPSWVCALAALLMRTLEQRQRRREELHSVAQQRYAGWEEWRLSAALSLVRSFFFCSLDPWVDGA